MSVLKNYVGGQGVESRSAETLDVIDPATEERIASCPAGSAADVDAAVRTANRAAPGWAAQPLEARIDRLLRAADRLAANIAVLAEIEQREMGRPASQGSEWIAGAVDGFRQVVESARDYPFEYATVADGSTTIVRYPVGTVALITPWNYPTNIILGALASLLASGNTIVLKPSEKTPMSAIRVAELMELPPGVLNLVLGDGRAGGPLTAHNGIDLVHFTGSVVTGTAIATESAGHLRRVVLELGGKDPVIVDAGIDVVEAAKDVARGAFLNSGQICTSIERIYVHRAVADEFISALVAEAEMYSSGDPAGGADIRMGPLVDRRQRETVIRHVEDAVARGARIRCGGVTPAGRGYYYPATVLTGVDDGMLIMREETFGPVAPVQVVDSFADGLEKATQTRFGLAATVYTNDSDHIRRARQIPAGIIWINRWQSAGTDLVYEPAGESGMAATGHFAAFDAATRPVAIVRS